jgi:hypothetical protein
LQKRNPGLKRVSIGSGVRYNYMLGKSVLSEEKTSKDTGKESGKEDGKAMEEQRECEENKRRKIRDTGINTKKEREG